MRKFQLSFLLILAVYVLGAFADDVVAVPTWLDSIQAFMLSPGAILSGVVAVLEFVIRAFPTAIPLSFLIPVQYAFSGIGKILVWFSENILTAMVNAANNVKK